MEKKPHIGLIQVCQPLANLLSKYLPQKNLYQLTATAENRKRIWYTIRLIMQQMCITTFSKYPSTFNRARAQIRCRLQNYALGLARNWVTLSVTCNYLKGKPKKAMRQSSKIH